MKEDEEGEEAVAVRLKIRQKVSCHNSQVKGFLCFERWSSNFLLDFLSVYMPNSVKEQQVSHVIYFYHSCM